MSNIESNVLVDEEVDSPESGFETGNPGLGRVALFFCDFLPKSSSLISEVEALVHVAGNIDENTDGSHECQGTQTKARKTPRS